MCLENFYLSNIFSVFRYDCSNNSENLFWSKKDNWSLDFKESFFVTDLHSVCGNLAYFPWAQQSLTFLTNVHLLQWLRPCTPPLSIFLIHKASLHINTKIIQCNTPGRAAFSPLWPKLSPQTGTWGTPRPLRLYALNVKMRNCSLRKTVCEAHSYSKYYSVG